MTSSALILQPSVTVSGLTEAEKVLVNRLLAKLGQKQLRNDLRTRYYDARETIRHLGIAVPPQLESVNTVVGWPAKSVDDLEQRIDLEGFVVPGGSWADFGLDVLWDENRMQLEASQGHASALKYAVSFVAVLAGDRGQPDVVIRPLSARGTTAIWDSVRRQVESALSVTGVDPQTGQIQEFILYTADHVVTCTESSGNWIIERAPHILGRAPIAVLPFKPDLESPFGTSRITRAVMSITDRAVRSLLRMEVSAEFYSSPQRYVLGAEEAMFVGPDGQPRTGWETVLGRLLAVPMTDGDQKPEVGQFPQLTMQPHMDMVRSDAALFSGETGIPVNSLGIIHDNPASEAAMQTAYLPLVKTAERASIPFGLGWVDAMKMAVQVRDNLSAPPKELAGMRAKFRNPATSTKTEAANAAVQFVTALPQYANSEVVLEMFGIDRLDIDRLVQDARRQQASSRLTQLVDAARQIRAVNSGDSAAGDGVSGGDTVAGAAGAA